MSRPGRETTVSREKSLSLSLSRKTGSVSCPLRGAKMRFFFFEYFYGLLRQLMAMQKDAQPEFRCSYRHRGDPSLRKERDRQQPRQRREMLRAVQNVARERERLTERKGGRGRTTSVPERDKRVARKRDGLQ